jgi:hypothetical protein
VLPFLDTAYRSSICFLCWTPRFLPEFLWRDVQRAAGLFHGMAVAKCRVNPLTADASPPSEF